MAIEDPNQEAFENSEEDLAPAKRRSKIYKDEELDERLAFLQDPILPPGMQAPPAPGGITPPMAPGSTPPMADGIAPPMGAPEEAPQMDMAGGSFEGAEPDMATEIQKDLEILLQRRAQERRDRAEHFAKKAREYMSYGSDEGQ